MHKKSSKLRSLILSALSRGEYAVGDRLPTESQLVEIYGYSRTVVRESVASLVADGILERRQGSGTYVTSLVPVPQRSNRIAAIVSSFSNPLEAQARVVSGMESMSTRHGYLLIVCSHDNDPVRVQQHVDRLAQDNVAGIILSLPTVPDADEHNAQLLRYVSQSGIPFVLMGSQVSGQSLGRFSFVGSNGFAASQEIVRHLVDVGHRRIAYITGFSGVWSSQQRLDGFLEESHVQGLNVPEEYVVPIGDVSLELQGRQAVRDLMALPQAPTAVICVHDLIAANVLDELTTIGKSCPGDLAVVGFDDQPFAATTTPPLTTVRVDNEEEGARAVEVLRDKIEQNSREERQILLPCELVIRESCGAPARLRNDLDCFVPGRLRETAS